MNFFAITPNDTNPQAAGARAIYVGVTGDLTVATEADGVAGAVTFKAVPVGWFVFPSMVGAITYVKATGTTATNLIGAIDPLDA